MESARAMVQESALGRFALEDRSPGRRDRSPSVKLAQAGWVMLENLKITLFHGLRLETCAGVGHLVVEQFEWEDRRSRRPNPLGTIFYSSHPVWFWGTGTHVSGPAVDRGKGVAP
uniref:Uncharacterized protein n=1 Tax=Ananas comosus var. bracteatus TaxID=296719 RepID=A0A6V7NIM0_ANACO|nr:unnamed protein product [Ananas comosus var. bracteatus]